MISDLCSGEEVFQLKPVVENMWPTSTGITAMDGSMPGDVGDVKVGGGADNETTDAK